MNLQKMANMATKQILRGIGLTMLMVVLLSSPCYADEIIFKDQGVQTGTVLEMDEETVTVRFPRQSIQSVIMGPEGVSTPEKKKYQKSAPLRDTRLQEKERIKRSEEDLERDKKADISPTPGPSKNEKGIEQLLRDEMGRVKGVILWKGKPLANGSVTIVLDTYTGFSWANLKKMFSRDKEDPSDQEITLATQTDSQGQYIFKEAPPGMYRLYLKPNPEAAWVRRLAKEPDFEVLPGEMTIYNIPRKKK